MTNNQRYQPEYPIIDVNDLLPRDQMQLVPERELSPIDRAELANLRRGVDYRYCVADTPQNREAIATITSYFQMVAYKEGWNFDPQKYQVRFVDPQHSLLSERGIQERIYEFQQDTKLEDLSPEGRVGFLIKKDSALRMEHERTDGLARRLLNCVFG